MLTLLSVVFLLNADIITYKYSKLANKLISIEYTLVIIFLILAILTLKKIKKEMIATIICIIINLCMIYVLWSALHPLYLFK